MLLGKSVVFAVLFALACRVDLVSSDACFCGMPGAVYLPDAMVGPGRSCKDFVSTEITRTSAASGTSAGCAEKLQNVSLDSVMGYGVFVSACCQLPANSSYYACACPVLTGREGSQWTGGMTPAVTDWIKPLDSRLPAGQCENTFNRIMSSVLPKSSPQTTCSEDLGRSLGFRGFCTSSTDGGRSLAYVKNASTPTCAAITTVDLCGSTLTEATASCYYEGGMPLNCNWNPGTGPGTGCQASKHYNIAYRNSSYVNYSGSVCSSISEEVVCTNTKIADAHCRGEGESDINGVCANINHINASQFGLGCGSTTYPRMKQCSWEGWGNDALKEIQPVVSACCTSPPVAQAVADCFCPGKAVFEGSRSYPRETWDPSSGITCDSKLLLLAGDAATGGSLTCPQRLSWFDQSMQGSESKDLIKMQLACCSMPPAESDSNNCMCGVSGINGTTAKDGATILSKDTFEEDWENFFEIDYTCSLALGVLAGAYLPTDHDSSTCAADKSALISGFCWNEVDDWNARDLRKAFAALQSNSGASSCGKTQSNGSSCEANSYEEETPCRREGVSSCEWEDDQCQLPGHLTGPYLEVAAGVLVDGVDCSAIQDESTCTGTVAANAHCRGDEDADGQYKSSEVCSTGKLPFVGADLSSFGCSLTTYNRTQRCRWFEASASPTSLWSKTLQGCCNIPYQRSIYGSEYCKTQVAGTGNDYVADGRVDTGLDDDGSITCDVAMEYLRGSREIAVGLGPSIATTIDEICCTSPPLTRKEQLIEDVIALKFGDAASCSCCDYKKAVQAALTQGGPVTIHTTGLKKKDTPPSQCSP